jgi:CRP/FNR family transcriptional regulator, cyclic AMP receptor protein
MAADDHREELKNISLAAGISEVKSIFANIGLFKDLSGDELGEIVRACKQVKVGPGEVLFEQGDEADALFIVGHGELEVIGKSQMGEKVVLAVLGQGTVVGEMSLIEGGPRSATVRSVSECDIFRLDRETFDELRAKRSRAAYKVILGLAATVGERRRQTDARIQEVFNDPASHIDAFESQLHEMLGRFRKS